MAYARAVAGGYSWSNARDGGAYRLPGPEHLGWWAAMAMAVSILLHVAVFLVLDHFRIGLDFSRAPELATEAINVQQVEVRPAENEVVEPPEDKVVPPNDAAPLLEEVDLLAKLPEDREIDIKPSVLEPEYALRVSNPAADGEPAAMAPDFSAGMEIETDLPKLGRMEESLPPAAAGQITVDPGAVQADDTDLNKFAEDLVKKGARGKVKGALDGLASLDDLIGLPANVLVNKKTMLPSDLLFEYNKAELRESAKVGLMKLGLLIDRNPRLYCWIEGHTDLIGGDEFNLDLSRRRAAAVRDYLVTSLRMDGDKIVTRGKGKAEPLVLTGSVEQQAPNRRVEIRMRKSPPPPEPAHPAPRAAPVEEAPKPVETPNAVPAEAPKATPVEETPKAVPAEVPKATPVQETPKAPPVEEAPKATPVEEAPKATPVEDHDPAEGLQPLEIPRAKAIEE